MVYSAKPANSKSFGVVVMVGINVLASADFAFLASYLPSQQRIRHRRCCQSFKPVSFVGSFPVRLYFCGVFQIISSVFFAKRVLASLPSFPIINPLAIFASPSPAGDMAAVFVKVLFGLVFLAHVAMYHNVNIPALAEHVNSHALIRLLNYLTR